MINVNSRVIVFAIGFDRSQGNSNYQVTIHYLSNLEGGGSSGGALLGGGGQTKGKPTTESTTGYSIQNAIQKLRSTVPGNLYLGNVQLIMIGPGMLKAGLRQVITYLSNQPAFTLNTLAIATSTPVSKFASSKPKGVSSAPRDVVKLFKSQMSTRGSFAPVEVWELGSNVYSVTGTLNLPVFSPSVNGVRMTGVDVLVQGHKVAEVPLDEALLIDSVHHATTGSYSIRPTSKVNYPVSVNLRSIHTSYTVSPWVHQVKVTVKGEGVITEGTSGGSKGTRSGGKGTSSSGTQLSHSQLVKYINQQLAQTIKSMLSQLYSKKADSFDIGERLREQSPGRKLPPWWSQRMTNLKFQVKSNIKFSDTGRGETR